MKRERSNLLKLLLALNKRMYFDDALFWEVNHYELGYQYECSTDELFEKGDWLMIKGLSLTDKGKFLVQMDLLVLTGDKILLYEEKAYSQPANDCQDGTIEFSAGGKRYTHPLEQVKDAHRKLEHVLKGLDIPLEVESYALLTHPNCYIYNLPAWTKNLLIQSQIEKHIDEQMKKRQTPTSLTKVYQEKLLALHHDISEYNSIVPEYNYNKLQKIVKCPQCFGVIDQIPKSKQHMTCPWCKDKIIIANIVRMAFDDYKILFNQKPTAAEMYHWCGGIFSKIRIQKILYEK